MGVKDISKKLSFCISLITAIQVSSLPDEEKIKYQVIIGGIYLVGQTVVDAIKAWKGRKPGTASNENQASK